MPDAPTGLESSHYGDGSRRGDDDRRKPPVGIKLLCIFGSIGTIVGLHHSARSLQEVLTISQTEMATSWVGASTPPIIYKLVIVVAAFTVALSLAQLFVFAGLWGMRKWAWVSGMFVFGLNIAISVVSFDIVGIFIGSLILMYLSTQREAYSHV